jgi:membrane peptidoglycan carboxypeptidase
MGYDDNTPLTGVTGAGLPAEIWRETMIRVHEGLTPRPLPMRAPIGAAERRDPQTANDTGTGIERILRDIFGGGGGGTPPNQSNR